MQEQMTKAMTQLTETVGEEVPTFEEVRNKIEKRLAKAQASTELSGAGVESKMLEVEQAQASAEAQARLSELRTELGLTTPPPPEGRAGGRGQRGHGRRLVGPRSRRGSGPVRARRANRRFTRTVVPGSTTGDSAVGSTKATGIPRANRDRTERAIDARR